MLFFISDASEKLNVDLKFALPGKERQDSVFSGFQVYTDLVLSFGFRSTESYFCLIFILPMKAYF